MPLLHRPSPFGTYSGAYIETWIYSACHELLVTHLERMTNPILLLQSLSYYNGLESVCAHCDREDMLSLEEPSPASVLNAVYFRPTWDLIDCSGFQRLVS